MISVKVTTLHLSRHSGKEINRNVQDTCGDCFCSYLYYCSQNSPAIVAVRGSLMETGHKSRVVRHKKKKRTL